MRLRVYRQSFLDAYQTTNNLYHQAYVDLLMQRHEEQPVKGLTCWL
ncbi:MAG: hypothetical protein V3T83_09740 [Acidobacteriota bacterium]